MKQEILLLTKKELLTTSNRRGFLLVEIILASSLFVMLLTAFAGVFLDGERASSSAGDRVQALLYAESGMEAVRNIRNADFLNLTEGQHGLLYASGTWGFSGTQDTAGIFTRNVVVTSLGKDRVGATTTVTWQQGGQGTGTVSLFRFFSNWLDLRYWYYPGIVSKKTLTNGGDKIQVEGNYAYVTSDAGGVLYIVDVTSSSSPSVVGSITLTGDLQNLYVSGNYAYVVSTDNTKELQVVNVTNKASPTLAGSYNAPGSEDANGLYIVGTKLYMTRQNGGQDEFAIINISNPANPALLGSLNLGATAFEPIVSGNYAYIASDNNTEELQIVNIANPASPFMAGTLNLSLKEQNRSSAVAINGTILYLGQGKDLYIIDVASTTNPVQKSNTSVADYFNDVSINLGKNGRYLFVATSDINKEFKVYDVSSTTAPVIYGTSLDLTGDNPSYGIAYSTSTNIVYVVGHSVTDSFFIIAP